MENESSNDYNNMSQTSHKKWQSAICPHVDSKSNVQKYADLLDFVNTGSEKAQTKSNSDQKILSNFKDQNKNQIEIEKIKEFYKNFDGET